MFHVFLLPLFALGSYVAPTNSATAADTSLKSGAKAPEFTRRDSVRPELLRRFQLAIAQPFSHNKVILLNYMKFQTESFTCILVNLNSLFHPKPHFFYGGPGKSARPPYCVKLTLSHPGSTYF